jgi:hypothetical protein
MQQKPTTFVLGATLSVSLLAMGCTPGAMTDPPGGSSGQGGSDNASGGRSGSGGGTGAGSGGNSSATGGGSGSGSGGNSGTGGGAASSSGGASGTGTGGGGSGTGTGGSGTGGGSGAGTGGAAGTGGSGGGADAGGGDGAALAKFSFFYTSLAGMRRLSGSQNGFGGDLRYGTANGLTGADKICQTLAADVGFGGKTWRAFLSVMKGPDGTPVNAIDRVGEGPWYDRRGRLIAMTKTALITGNRPMGGDSAAVNDMTDENGMGKPAAPPNDTHDVITGTNTRGTLRATKAEDTCMDWTSTTVRGSVGVGHAWPAGSGMNWMQAHTEASCAAGVNLVQNGPGNGSSIGAGGGWGGFYCFALTP